MAVASTLGELTQSADSCKEIPAYLGRVLRVEPITLALVRDSGQPSLFLCASTVTETQPGAVSKGILDIYRQTRPLSTDQTPAMRPAFDADVPGYPRATVFAQQIDPAHRMLLIVHQKTSDTLSSQTTEVLQHIASHLAKLLACLITWETNPASLGTPFATLTPREWIIAQGLESDAGEKQLADKLDLSVHTLHSHVKSIYRKFRVQGRLPTLQHMKEARRSLRLSRINGPSLGAVVSHSKTSSAPLAAAAAV